MRTEQSGLGSLIGGIFGVILGGVLLIACTRIRQEEWRIRQEEWREDDLLRREIKTAMKAIDPAKRGRFARRGSRQGLRRGSDDTTPNRVSDRFVTELNQLTFGQPETAAHGIKLLLRVDDTWAAPSDADGVEAIVKEFTRAGSRIDQECLDYVLNHRAGSSPTIFNNGPFPRDCDAGGLHADRQIDGVGMQLDDFLARSPPGAKLKRPHVLALRLYTSAAFKSINGPLRDVSDERPHPLPVTVHFIEEGIKRLRAAEAPEKQSAFGLNVRDSHGDKAHDVEGGRATLLRSPTISIAARSQRMSTAVAHSFRRSRITVQPAKSYKCRDATPADESSVELSESRSSEAARSSTVLWRGIKDARVDDDFVHRGGTERAPMSTTRDLKVALEYCASNHPILIRLCTESFMERGASLAFLSCFPLEVETLFPPLTYLGPPRMRKITLRVDGGTHMRVTVLDIKPKIG